MTRKRGKPHRPRRADGKRPERQLGAAERPPLAAELRRTIPLVIGISILNFLLASFGILRPIQLGLLDAWLRIQALRPDPKNIVIVAINNNDYETLFKSTCRYRKPDPG
jgi:CHASE2 domain-containing sensor protein